MSPKNDRLLTSREAAELLNRREQTLAAWRTRQTPDRPTPVLVGKRVRYREADVLAFRDRETKVVAYREVRKKRPASK
jgi:hypothetical protein